MSWRTRFSPRCGERSSRRKFAPGDGSPCETWDQARQYVINELLGASEARRLPEQVDMLEGRSDRGRVVALDPDSFGQELKQLSRDQ